MPPQTDPLVLPEPGANEPEAEVVAPEAEPVAPRSPANHPEPNDYGLADRLASLLAKLKPAAKEHARKLNLDGDHRALQKALQSPTERGQVFTLEKYFADQYEERLEQETPPAEILPSFESLKRNAESLTRGDRDALQKLIVDIADARLSHTEQDMILGAIKEQTGSSLPSLKKDVRDTKTELKRLLEPPSPRRAPTDWQDSLVRDDSEQIRPILANVHLALTCDKNWAGALATDLFTGTIMLIGPTPLHKGEKVAFVPRPLTDEDALQITVWLQVAGIPAPSHIVFEGIRTAADQSHYHPVRDYLDSLVWDGKPRLDDLFVSYFGAGGDPPDEAEGKEALERWNSRFEYYRAVGARFPIGAVARIYEPGCKNDTMPILVGAQGTFKSSALRVRRSRRTKRRPPASPHLWSQVRICHR